MVTHFCFSCLTESKESFEISSRILDKTIYKVYLNFNIHHHILIVSLVQQSITRSLEKIIMPQ